jgi:hypothetical protein
MRFLFVALLATETLLGGCATGRGSRPGTAPPRTVLEVDNRSLSDMTIYVMNGGQRMRLGTATALRQTELTIPASMITGARQLSFVADPLGSNRKSLSEEIYVTPGDRVGIVILP